MQENMDRISLIAKNLSVVFLDICFLLSQTMQYVHHCLLYVMQSGETHHMSHRAILQKYTK